MKKPEHAIGYGIRVGGPHPYLAYEFHYLKKNAVAGFTQQYHTTIKCVLITYREWCRLKRKAGEPT